MKPVRTRFVVGCDYCWSTWLGRCMSKEECDGRLHPTPSREDACRSKAWASSNTEDSDGMLDAVARGKMYKVGMNNWRLFCWKGSFHCLDLRQSSEQRTKWAGTYVETNCLKSDSDGYQNANFAHEKREQVTDCLYFVRKYSPFDIRLWLLL